MMLFKRCLTALLERMKLWVKYGLKMICGAFPILTAWLASPVLAERAPWPAEPEEWKTNVALRTYPSGGGGTLAKVQTSTHAFYVDLGQLSQSSEFFRALAQSRMRETRESLVRLDHVSSTVFYHFLEFSFNGRFHLPLEEELAAHIWVGSYLLAEAFLTELLSLLAKIIRPENCLSYLNLAQEICCEELKMTVFSYLSVNLLELSDLTRSLSAEEREELVLLRTRGRSHLCSLRKENLTSWQDPETEEARQVFLLNPGSEDGGRWRPLTRLPFAADKWCLTAVVLYNYLYILGGHRQQVGRGWHFKMASFRYNPLSHTWISTAPLIKHRRHFSAVACDGRIYAVGGWYLDSLVAPDSATSLYTAVERYHPWEDTWRFVSSLPLTDFQFTLSLSHDVPLAASLGHCVYVLGSIQRTGEKLLLRYDTREDVWSELAPTLSRAAADLPTLSFLGATDRLVVIGGNNSSSVVTSYCVRTGTWGEVHAAQKVALVGQGTVAGERVLMPSVDHNSVAEVDLDTLSVRTLPPRPVSTSYEAVFFLHF